MCVADWYQSRLIISAITSRSEHLQTSVCQSIYPFVSKKKRLGISLIFQWILVKKTDPVPNDDEKLRKNNEIKFFVILV